MKQIFPPRDRSQLAKYIKLLETSCGLYEPGLLAEQKQELQRFVVQKVYWHILLKYWQMKAMDVGKQTMNILPVLITQEHSEKNKTQFTLKFIL